MTREEFQENFILRRLNIGDSISAFDCNDEDLNDFLINESNLYRNALLSVTYVVEDKESRDIIAYFSLSNDKISISDFENIQNSIVFASTNLSMRKDCEAIPRLKSED